ncbi:MAG: hypothetical protein ABJA79_04960 [Parafilimonas sp.]
MKKLISAAPENSLTKNVLVIGNARKGHHYWIGYMGDGIDHFAGQTFKIHRPGILKTISIFPEMIVGETDALLSVFEFNEAGHEWKEKKTEKHLMLDKSMQNQWIRFDINDMMLDDKKQYAFKISCNHGGMMAIAEGPWAEKDPYPDGQEWIGSSANPAGNFHRNFDLAFAAEIHHS